MATKKIQDLQLRSDADATCQLPTDDATQTWRITLAQVLSFFRQATTWITDNTAVTDLEAADTFAVYDDSATAMRKVTKNNLVKKIVAAKTGAYTATADDDLLLCNATSAAFTVTLPAASGLTGKSLIIKKTDSSANAVTVDGNSSETIDGYTTIQLAAINDWLEIVSDGSNWHKVAGFTTSVVDLHTSNGYGSTNNKIRRWTTTARNIGSGITYADSATLGASFTINEAGVYTVRAYDNFTGTTDYIGVSLNTSEPTINISTITDADRLDWGVTNVANTPAQTGVTRQFAAGDVIRIHCSGAATAASQRSRVTISRVA